MLLDLRDDLNVYKLNVNNNNNNSLIENLLGSKSFRILSHLILTTLHWVNIILQMRKGSREK